MRHVYIHQWDSKPTTQKETLSLYCAFIIHIAIVVRRQKNKRFIIEILVHIYVINVTKNLIESTKVNAILIPSHLCNNKTNNFEFSVIKIKL